MSEKLKPSLLLLEDDINLNETICEYLEDQGFCISPVYTGEDAQDLLYEKSFDLLLLDVNVPAPSGFELLALIRKDEIQTPAIFLTSLNGMQDLEMGFDVGCDDYMRKPFALKELLLRIQSILKRNFNHQKDDKQILNEHFSYDTKEQLLYQDEQIVKMHYKEQKLLQLFLQHQDEALSHERIKEHLWNFDEEPSDLSLRTYIKDLRKILGKDSIESIKRYGYKFSLQREKIS